MKKTFKAKIIGGKLIPYNPKLWADNIKLLEGRDVLIDIQKFRKRRTDKQNRALHLWFRQMAKLLNDHGWDQRKLIKEEFDIPWTTETFKDNLWRKIQIAYCGKKSTTEINTEEITAIYDILNKAISERTKGLSLPFPDINLLIDRE